MESDVITCRTIQSVDVDYFLNDGKCWLESLDGVQGFIRLEDALVCHLVIYVPKREAPLTYCTVEGLLRAGWRVIPA